MTARLATNNNGIITWRWEGKAFGNTPVRKLGTISVNLRFPGQYYDSETNLHYNWHRYYDPTLGRYITSDPVGLEAGTNTYTYAHVNPIGNIDPTGEIVQVIAALGRIAVVATVKCVRNKACRCRAVHATYKRIYGIRGCRNKKVESCSEARYREWAAKLCHSLRKKYVAMGCDRVIPTIKNHQAEIDNARKKWLNCVDVRKKLCCGK